MTIFSKNTFEKLAGYNSSDSATFYIPTDREGNNEKAKIIFKNQIMAVKKLLETSGKGDKFIQSYTGPLLKMLDDSIFWRHLSDGLAIFHSPELHEIYTVPVPFEDFYSLGTEFHLTPIIPFFNGNGRFYIMTISRNETKLYEGSRDEIGRIDIADLIPGTLEDSVGRDFKQKSLQIRTEKTKTREALFHGHGAGKDDRESELMEYLHDIDRGFTSFAGKSGKPLIIASVDEIFAKYKKVNNYKDLFPHNISENADETDVLLLHEKAWDLLEEEFTELNREAVEKFNENMHNGKTSTDIKKIIEESMAGHVDTLFISKNHHIWGKYNPENESINIQDHPDGNSECFVDKVGKAVFLQGGQVFIQDASEMPDNSSPVNALMRY